MLIELFSSETGDGDEWLWRFIKAVFAEGSETPAKKFYLCEKDLELEF